MAKGLCREKDGWGKEDSVRVKFADGHVLDVPASHYVANGYAPPIDELPWEDVVP